jgi:hypothetical protein
MALVPELALAQVSATASAQAAELFEQGRALVQKQDFRTACPKFADSLALEPKVGTLLNLADCEEHTGELVAARGHWQDAANMAHSIGDDREPLARQRFSIIDARVPKLTVSLAPSAPPSTRATRDGVELGAGSIGSPLPVDPGAHAVVASAPGYADRSYQVTLGEGEAKTVLVEPGLRAATPGSGEAVAPLPPHAGNTRKTVGFVAAGAGASGVAVGTIFGVLAWTKYDASNSGDCTAKTAVCSTQAGVSERATAYRDGNVSTIAFVAGGAVLAAGIVLWLTAPSAEAGPAAGVSLGPGGLSFRGVFE